MRVAVISNRNRPGYPDENLKDHLAWTGKAAKAGARLIQFPELSLSGYSTQPFVKRQGMDLDSARCADLIGAARSHDVFIAFGIAAAPAWAAIYLAGAGGTEGCRWTL